MPSIAPNVHINFVTFFFFSLSLQADLDCEKAMKKNLENRFMMSEQKGERLAKKISKIETVEIILSTLWRLNF